MARKKRNGVVAEWKELIAKDEGLRTMQPWCRTPIRHDGLDRQYLVEID